MSGGQCCLVRTQQRRRRYDWGVRAFTLLEVMVVVVIVGILSALGGPSIVRMVGASESNRALVESVTMVSTARDSARGFGTCLEYKMEPGPPAAGPYTVKLAAISCPGDSGLAVSTPIGSPQPMSRTLTQLTVRPVISWTGGGEGAGPGGELGAPIDTIRFDRSGALYDPIAELRFDGVYNGEKRSFTVFPAAGTITVEERK